MTENSRKIAILGGGMGALATAWRLSGASDCEITIYQRDHLLGGKGASARNQDPLLGHRIEEHGIHILMGWYEQSVRLLREAYEESSQLQLPPKLGRVLPWSEVLFPHDSATMAEAPELTGGDWEFWTVNFPRRKGFPGDGEGPSGFAPLVVRAVRWLAWLRARVVAKFPVDFAAPSFLEAFDFADHVEGEEYSDGNFEWTDEEADAWLATFHRQHTRADLDKDGDDLSESFLRRGINRLIEALSPNDPFRHVFMSYWFASAMVRGLLAEGVTSRSDFEKFNDVEFRDWLKKHGRFSGLAPRLTWDSPIVRILYDLAFGHGKGFAAGVWAWAVLLFAFGYKGSYVYKMNGGMGDIVFAPLYLALKRRGVKFRFLHEVRDIETDGQRVTALKIRDLGGFGDDYEPLVGVEREGHGRMPCWPAAPMRKPGPSTELRLEVGRDFDDVVLAIGVGGHAGVCDRLRANPKYDAMLTHSATVGTQAAQVWLDRDARSLGWQGADELVACYVRPFNSCVQMNHVLASETWPAAGAPKTVVYYCDQAPDGTTHDQVKKNLRDFLATTGKALMPRFDWKDLHDAAGRAGEARLDAQYWRSNVVGSDRYVITPPGSPAWRLAPGDSGFSNLVLAGDWTRTDVDAGCLEAATRSGLEAGDALLPARVRGPVRAYVDTPVDWVRKPPLRFGGATMNILLLPADGSRLRRVCEQLVASPSGGAVVVEPLLDAVVACFAKVDRGASAPESGDGSLAESECVFFVPVRGRRGTTFEVGALAVLAYVDNPIAVVAGREIYGFPKFPAQAVRIGVDPVHFEVEAFAQRRFGPGEKAAPATIVRVTEEGDAAGDGWREIAAEVGPHARAAALALVAGLGVEADLFLEEFGVDLLGTVNLLFLKQLRDAASPRDAAYQEILTAPARTANLSRPRVRSGRFRVEFPPLARPAIADWLGLEPVSTASTLVSVDMDFEFGLGRKLWSATAS